MLVNERTHPNPRLDYTHQFGKQGRVNPSALSHVRKSLRGENAFRIPYEVRGTPDLGLCQLMESIYPNFAVRVPRVVELCRRIRVVPNTTMSLAKRQDCKILGRISPLQNRVSFQWNKQIGGLFQVCATENY